MEEDKQEEYNMPTIEIKSSEHTKKYAIWCDLDTYTLFNNLKGEDKQKVFLKKLLNEYKNVRN